MITRFLSYELRLGAPLLLADEGGDPNSVRSLAWIPGSTMRGIAAGRLGPSAADFESIILSGTVRFLPAYPCLPDAPDERAVPVPLSWHRRRDNEDEFADLSVVASDGDSDSDGEEDASVQWLRPDFPFVLLRAEPVRVRAAVKTRFHHQRDRQVGRATEMVGAVFVYEAVEPGTRFRGVIQVSATDEAACGKHEARIREVFNLGEGVVQIGRSRSTEYGGRVTIRVDDGWRVRQVDAAAALPLSAEGVIEAGTRLQLQLLSPAVVRGLDTGHVDPAALSDVIVAALGRRVRTLQQFTASTIVGSFNHAWRMEVPQALAVAAGSVLTLEAIEALPHQDLLALEHAGIGDRRADGYGTFAWMTVPRHKAVPISRRPPAVVTWPRPAEPCAGPILDGLQQRLYAAVVDRAIERYAVEIVRDAPKNEQLASMRSLLGRLRVPLRNPATWERTFAEWLDPAKEAPKTLRRDARDKLERYLLIGAASSGSRRPQKDKKYLDEWLRELAYAGGNHEPPATGNPNEVRVPFLESLAAGLFPGDALARWSLDDSLPAEPPKRVRERLALEARHTLIDRVLALLSKKSVEAQKASENARAVPESKR